jgi:glycosyltransferase involved in cell wall biosynthesis
MTRVAVVASRNFNPGHCSHLVATHKLLSGRGLRVLMLLHPSFKSMDMGERDTILTNVRDLRHVGRVELLVVTFPSVQALFDMVLMKWRYRTSIAYVFHEPFESIRAYWNAGFGARKTARICLIAIINWGIVLLSDKVILPSKKAEAIFRAKYSRPRQRYAMIPLLFDDEAQSGDLEKERRYIAYIGTVAEDHAFDEFLRFVGRAIDSHLFTNHRYLVATGSSLSVAARALVAPLVASGRLEVLEGRPLSNAAINDCFASSVVVWNAYKRSMQSGVLPKAYMFGTPLLVSSSTQSEFFTDRHTGVLISDRYDVGEIKDAIANIIENFAEYSAACRRRFLDIFYYQAQSQAFAEFVLE